MDNEFDPNDSLGEVKLCGECVAYMFLDTVECELSIEFIEDPESLEFDADIDECELIGEIADELQVNELDVELRYYKD